MQYEEYNLNETTKASSFSHFWNVIPLTFSLVLFHQVMLHKIKVDVEKAKEMQFYIAQKELRFGVVEFVLITSLNFTSGPTKEEKTTQVACSESDQLINKYFNWSDSMKIETLQEMFPNC
uniref:DUF1985 domain-containing protein n=1 Tax=Cannabis sativa TaxID=3483 RepID=A0A803QI36_CANSA